MLEPTFALLLGPALADPRPLRRPMSGMRVDAGFPSPAEDFLDEGIDLHEWLVTNQPATFYYRASGISMVLEGICDGDTLIVDRSVQPKDGDLVIAAWDGQAPICKRLKVARDHIELHSRNLHFQPIILLPGTEVEVFAVVGVCRKVVRDKRRARVGR